MGDHYYIKVDSTCLKDNEGQFKTIHVSNRNTLNVKKIRGISVCSLSANFKSEKKYEKVIEIVTNFSQNFVWSQDGQTREERPVPLLTLHLKQETGRKFFSWTNPNSQPWAPVTNPDELLNLWCRDVFSGNVIKDDIEIALLVCFTICN